METMPSCLRIDCSSPSHPQCAQKKNGIHKRSSNGNGLSKILHSEVISFLKSSSPEKLTEEQEKVKCEGEELIRSLENNPKNLAAVEKFVQKYNDQTIKWDNGYYLRFCGLNGTIYMGQKYMQESWEQLYLPKKTRMQVLGTLENSRVILPSVPWIILVGEDGCVYAYGEEELQTIAKSFREFVENGKRKPYKTYDYPDLSEEEDESLQQDEEIMKIRQRTRDFVNKSADEFDNFLSHFIK